MTIPAKVALAISAYGDEMWNLGSGFPARVADTRAAMLKVIEEALVEASKCKIRVVERVPFTLDEE